MATKTKPWAVRWQEKEVLGSGGQGTTKIVVRREDADGQEYALKQLNRSEDPERRTRMHREVTNLTTLDHTGIPKVIESNTQDFKDPAIPLFVVMERIEGMTLSKKVESTPLSIQDALSLGQRLCEIVAYCHDRNIIHRDIKPDNVLLRRGTPSDPVLLDFGLSFNVDPPDNTLTLEEQQLGNRFLALPELQSPGDDKRDRRSDVTAICGLVLFALSGAQPMTLLDAQGRKPHQRDRERKTLDTLPQHQRAPLLRLFDVAFEIAIDLRHQSAEMLKAELERIIAMKPPEVDGESATDLAAAVREKLASDSQLKKGAQIQSSIKRALQLVDDAFSALIAELGQAGDRFQAGYEIDLARLKGTNKLGWAPFGVPERVFFPQFAVALTGNEIVITATEKSGSEELLRAPLNGISWEEEIKQRVRDYSLEGIHRRLNE